MRPHPVSTSKSPKSDTVNEARVLLVGHVRVSSLLCIGQLALAPEPLELLRLLRVGASVVEAEGDEAEEFEDVAGEDAGDTSAVERCILRAEGERAGEIAKDKAKEAIGSDLRQ